MKAPNITPGPWALCHHLQSIEKDQACPCGYNGGIWGPDGEHIICEMGPHIPDSQNGFGPARYERKEELANARAIAAVPDLIEALLMVSELWLGEDVEEVVADALKKAGCIA